MATVISGNNNKNRLAGTGDDDHIYGYGDNDGLSGQGGNDWLDGGTGADTMIGGIGDDTYWVDNAGDKVIEDADAGADLVYSSISYTLTDNVEHLYLTGSAALNGTGNGLDNTLQGNSGNNVLNGGDGDDKLLGGVGMDTMIGGSGDDIYEVDNAGDVVVENAGEGLDWVMSSISYSLVGSEVEDLQLVGTAVNGTGNGLDNMLMGNAMSNTLNGGDGDDWLIGGAGIDTMIGGSGDDDYYVEDAGDKVTENAFQGTDRVFAWVSYELKMNIEELHLMESAGAIDGTGNNLDNTLVGNSNGNTLDGGDGTDVMSGMAGDDTYWVDDTGDQVIEYANGGTDWVWSEVTFFMFGSEVENLFLFSSGDIDGSGNDIDNQIYGTAGINMLYGHGGDDHLYGFGEHDWIWGGSGDDTIDGGADGNSMHGNADNDTITATGNQNSAFGDDGNDQLFFASNGNALAGGSGGDWLGVSGDSNLLYGEADNDYLGATGDSNVLDGGAGNDTLEAAAGHSNDKFIFHAGYDQDTIIGFSTAGGDTVHLETFGLANFAQLQPYMSQAGNDVVIALNGTDILTLQNVQLNTLTASHFDLV